MVKRAKPKASKPSTKPAKPAMKARAGSEPLRLARSDSLAVPGVQGSLTLISYQPPRQLEFDEWERDGLRLRRVHRCSLWWIGDWVNAGAQRWGEKHAQAIDAGDYDANIVKDCAWVCEKFPVDYRVADLSFSHHKILAGLELKDALRWLRKAMGPPKWSLAELRKALREANKKEGGPLPDGAYLVVLADPLWHYSNNGFEKPATGGARSAAQHYAPMATKDICELKVEECTTAESVLFLWSTVPMLEDAFQVLRAWGFSYKTSFVWWKHQSPGIGWWADIEHEYLLVGAREGNHQPKVKLKSVFEAPPAQRSHSSKPEFAYELIEQMYEGPYLELFARQERPGWTAWGAELEPQKALDI